MTETQIRVLIWDAFSNSAELRKLPLKYVYAAQDSAVHIARLDCTLKED